MKNKNKFKDKQFIRIYKKVRYRVNKINELNESKAHGYKSKRSTYYKQIVELNNELINVCKKKGYGLPLSKQKKITRVEVGKSKRRVFDVEKEIITYKMNAWQFEDKLKDFLNAGTFNSIYFKNLGKIHYKRVSRISTVLATYDDARNEAYSNVMATTPLVEVTEDYSNSKLSLLFVS